MARRRDPGLEAVRGLVREAFLDPNLDWGRDPAIFEEHPSELQFASYIDQLLGDAEEAAFERHVAGCAQCAEELVLSTRVAAGQRRREKSSYWKMAAGFAVVLGGLVAAALVGRTAGGYLEDSLLAGLEKGLGGRATANSAAVSLLGGPRVEFDGFKVNDPAGGDPLVVASSARFDVDLASLRDGEFSGELELDHPVFNVVRRLSGDVNIDALLPSSEGIDGLFAGAARNSVRAVRIKDGTIRIMDEATAGGGEVRMADVDAEISGISAHAPARLKARAGVESASQNLALAGTVGPWGGGKLPRYRFSEVDLDTVPLRALAWVRGAVRGGLSYDGTLQTVGNGWKQISSNVSGAGLMQVVSGALVGKNVVAETIRPWIGEGDAPAKLGAVLAGSDTPFDEIRTAVAVRGSALTARDLRAVGGGFEVLGNGSLESSGVIDFSGTLLVSAELSAELVAIAPLAGRLLNDERRLAIPFEVAGTWPEVQPRIDLELVASRAFSPMRLALLWLAPRAPLPRAG